MADWSKFRKHVHSVEGKVNYIDPNDLLISNERYEDGLKANSYYNSIKDTDDIIRHTWSPDDYCIDVDIMMEVPSRNDYATTTNGVYLLNWNGKTGNISLQSGQRFYYGRNKKTDNAELQANMAVGDNSLENFSHVNYMSTRDTDVNFQDIMTDYISTEMLGIESISIKYNNNFCPQVMITMTDVRGISVFSPLERTHTKIVDGVSGYDRNDIAGSFYRALFNLPYPKVTMRVKGLYGAPTTYDLTFEKIDQEFDSSNGCFKVNLSLIGYFYSFMTQIPATHALLSPYFTLFGGAYWDNIIKVNEKYKLNGSDPVTWIEMVKRIADADVQIQNARNNGSGPLHKIKLCNDILNQLKAITEDYRNCETEYLKDLKNILSANGFVEHTDFEISRIYNGDTQPFYCYYVLTDNKIEYNNIEYNNILKQSGGYVQKAIEKNTILQYKGAKEKYDDDFNKLNELLKDVFGAEYCLGSLNFNSEISVKIPKGKVDNANKKVYNTEYYETLWNVIDEYLNNDELPTKMSQFNSMNLIIPCVYDTKEKNITFYNAINKITFLVKATMDGCQSGANSEISKITISSLGFMPTLKNVMKLLIEHCECYFYSLYTLGAYINTQKNIGKRNVNILGLDMLNSDFRTNDIPPFPEVTKMQNGKRVKSWTGSLDKKNNFLETNFVLSVVNASYQGISYLNAINSGQGMTRPDYGNILFMNDNDQFPKPKMMFPVTYNDYFETGTAFHDLNDNAFQDFCVHGNMSQLATVLYFRFLEYYNGYACGTHIPKNETFSIDGKIDAYNFYVQFIDKMYDNGFNGALHNFTSKTDYTKLFINLLNGRGHIDFDDNKELLTNYYQNQLGFDDVYDFTTKNMYTLPNHNDGYTFNGDVLKSLMYAVSKNKPSDEINKETNISDACVIAYYDENESDDIDVVKFKALGDSISYKNFYNYFLIDKNDQYFKSKVVYTEQLKKALKINDLNGVLLNDFYTEIIIDADNEIGSWHGDDVKNESIYSFSNEFLSLVCNKRSIYEQLSYFLIDNYKSDGSSFNVKNALSQFDTSGKKSIEYVEFLRDCAVCYAHLYNNDVLYSLNLSDVHYLNVVLGLTGDTNSGVIDVKVNLGEEKFNRIHCAMALYFKEWAETDGKKLISQINDAYGNMLLAQCDSIVDLISYIKNHVLQGTSFNGDNFDEVKQYADKYGIKNIFNGKMYCKDGIIPYKDIITELSKKVKISIYIPVQHKFDIECRDLYFKSFFDELLKLSDDLIKKVKEERANGGEHVVINNAENYPEDVCISVYQATKRLWDEWLCGNTADNISDQFNRNWLNIDFFNNRFHFIDTFYNNIGDEILIDPTILTTTFNEICGQQQGWNILSYINTILGKSNIAFYNIQNWADLGNSDTMAKAFVPMTYDEAHNLGDINSNLSSTNSDFVCIYSYEPSHLVGFGGDGDTQSDYVGDGFDITVDDNLHPLPASVGYNMGGQWRIPAFAVSYGKQYQSYFTNIKVSTQNGTQSEWGMLAMLNIAKMGSDTVGDNIAYRGQDLYTVQSNQSFTAEADVLGCCWIQPFMYFVITNIPMYRGTYMIYEVSHRITAGNMITHFKGYKMSRFATKLVDNAFQLHYNDLYEGEDSYVADNVVASVNNDCAYKVYPFNISIEVEDMRVCNTVDVESLKMFRPYYVDSVDGNLFECIAHRMSNEVSDDDDELTLKMVAMCYLNEFVYYYKKSNYSETEDIWKFVVCNSFGNESGPKETSDLSRKCLQEVFTNPKSAFSTMKLNKPEGVITPLKRSGQSLVEIKNTDEEWLKGVLPIEVNNINVHKTSTSSDSNSSFTNYGNHVRNENSAYDITTKVVGTIGEIQTDNQITDDLMRRLFMFTPAGCYLYDNVVTNALKTNPDGSLDTKWDYNFVCINGLSDKDAKVYVNTAEDSVIWTDEEWSNIGKKLSIKNTNYNLAEMSREKFVECISKSVGVTDAFDNKNVKVIAQDEWLVVLTMEDTEENGKLFDMLMRQPDDKNTIRGYFTSFSKIAWLTKSANRKNPDYILVDLKIDTQSKVFYHIYTGEISKINQDIAEKMFTSNVGDYANDNGDLLNKYSTTFMQTMAKNIPDDDKYFHALHYSHAFGGTDYFDKHWGQKIDEEKSLRLHLEKWRKNINKCADVIQSTEDNGNGDLNNHNFNENLQDFFKRTNANYKERTIYVSSTNKLKIVNDNEVDDKTFGVFQRSNKKDTFGKCILTSQWAKCRKWSKTAQAKPHEGTDFGSGSIVASYDGVIIGKFCHTNDKKGKNNYQGGYGNMVFIAYNVQIEKNGKKYGLVCGYAHINNNDTKSYKIGDIVHKGQFIAPTGNSNGSTNSPYGNHLHMMFLLVPVQYFYKNITHFFTNDMLFSRANGVICVKDMNNVNIDFNDYCTWDNGVIITSSNKKWDLATYNDQHVYPKAINCK